MTTTSNERSRISMIHGLPESGIRKPTEGVWQHSPTPIVVPGKQHASTSNSVSMNPFTNGLLNSRGASKGQKTQPKRPTRAVHAMKGRGEPPAKKRKSTENGSGSSSKVPLPPEDDDIEFINVDTNSDDLNLAENGYVPGKKASFSVAPDGPSTQALARRHSSPIESFPPGPSIVKERVKHYEAMDPAKASTTAPPRLDLRELQTKKRKQPTASANNPFKRKQTDDWLPVNEYITENEAIDRSCKLYWNQKEYQLCPNSESSRVVHFNSVNSIQCTPLGKAPESCYIVINNCILLSFDPHHSQWSANLFNSFKRALASHVKPNECTSISTDTAVGIRNHFRSLLPSHLQQTSPREPEPALANPSDKKQVKGIQPTTSRHFQSTKGLNKGGGDTISEVSVIRDTSNPLAEQNAAPALSKGKSKMAASEQAVDAVRRSTRQPAAKKPLLDPDEVILVYPFNGPGAVNITNADVARLEPGEFLNDTLIEFGLKLWLARLEETNKELADQVHVFSSFFYKKLNKKPQHEGYNSVRKWTSRFDLFKKKYIIVPINEHMHWYLGLIYEPEHVLKANNPPDVPTAPEPPGLDSPESALDQVQEGATPSDTHSEIEVEADLTTLTKACSLEEITADLQVEPDMEVDTTAVPPAPQHPSPTLSYADPVENIQERSESEPDTARPISPMCISPEIEVMDARSSRPPSSLLLPPPAEMSADEDIVPADDLNLVSESNEIPPASFYGTGPSTRQSKKQTMKFGRRRQNDKPLEMPKPKPDTTYVFTMDSLGTAHTHASSLLARYLVFEAKDKKSVESEIRKITKNQAFVPTQPNFCDCGLYLLHLAQTFISDPQSYLEKSIRPERASTNAERKKDWLDDKVPEMRGNLLREIQRLSEEWKQMKKEKEKEKGKEKENSRDKSKEKEKEEPDQDNIPAPKPAEVEDDSDGDIQVIETVPAPKKAKKPAGPSSITTRNQAQSATQRLRG